MTMPLPQKPHWQACSAMKARCSGMELLDRAEALDRGDLALRRGRRRRHARARGPTVDQDRAGPALGQPAAVLRAVQLEIVAQDVEERSVRLDRDGLRCAVHPNEVAMISSWSGAVASRARRRRLTPRAERATAAAASYAMLALDGAPGGACSPAVKGSSRSRRSS